MMCSCSSIISREIERETGSDIRRLRVWFCNLKVSRGLSNSVEGLGNRQLFGIVKVKNSIENRMRNMTLNSNELRFLNATGSKR
jgi:hypothetical protein